MRCLNRLLGLFGAAVLLAAAPAHAAQFLYTVSGYVVGEELTFDEYHIFDPEQGEAFVAQFLLDDASVLGLYSYGATGSSASGGALVQYGTRAPVVSRLTIGGTTHVIPTGDLYSYPTPDPVSGDSFGPTDIVEEAGTVMKDASLGKLTLSSLYGETHSCCGLFTAYADSEGEFLAFDLTSSEFTDPDYRQVGTFVLSPATGGGGGGGFFKYEATIEHPGAFSQVLLRATMLTVAQTSAVPELGTWLMMVLGIGTVGLAIRAASRRRATGGGDLVCFR